MSYNDGRQDARIEALHHEVKEMREDLGELRGELLTHMDRMVIPIRAAVFGNGNAESGLVARVLHHDKIIAWGLITIGTIAAAALAKGFL